MVFLEIGSKFPASGNGKICKDELNTPRAKMSAYMNSLKISKGYASLKSKYLESQSKNFPLLGGDTVPPGENDMDTMDAVHNDHFPSNPIVERDSKIKELQESLAKAIESVQNKNELLASLEEKQKEEADKLSTAQKKISTIYQGTASRLLKDITNVESPITEEEDINIACKLLAVSFLDTNMKEEDIEKMNSEAAPPELKNDFFKPFRDSVDLSNSGQAERFSRVRNKVVENLKHTVRSRSRRLSMGSKSPASKRGNSGEEKDEEKPPKVVNNRPSPKKDTVPKSGLPQFKNNK